MQPRTHSYFNGGGRTPPRTAAHSFCIESKRILPAPTLLPDCARLCSPAPAASEGWVLLPAGHRSLSAGALPPFPALRALPRTRRPSPPGFLASKLARLICCDRSNLPWKAEVHRQSSPPGFPKAVRSFRCVTLNGVQQRKKVSLKGSEDLEPSPRIQTEVQLPSAQ